MGTDYLYRGFRSPMSRLAGTSRGLGAASPGPCRWRRRPNRANMLVELHRRSSRRGRLSGTEPATERKRVLAAPRPQSGMGSSSSRIGMVPPSLRRISVAPTSGPATVSTPQRRPWAEHGQVIVAHIRAKERRFVPEQASRELPARDTPPPPRVRPRNMLRPSSDHSSSC
jgi:hypothetical protein